MKGSIPRPCWKCNEQVVFVKCVECKTQNYHWCNYPAYTHHKCGLPKQEKKRVPTPTMKQKVRAQFAMVRERVGRAFEHLAKKEQS